jgi:riboflavin synthase
MFTGLITACAPLLASESVAGGRRLRLANPYGPLALGESIAVNGVCLTVETHDAETMTFFASPETLGRTSLSRLQPGHLLNLERALRASDRLGGHIVQGHVDGLGRLETVRDDHGSWRLDFSLPAELARYCIVKGSICLDGISLTINGLDPVVDDRMRLWVQIIPHTWQATHLHTLKPGDPVNVEVDPIAKYVERLCHPYLKP